MVKLEYSISAREDLKSIYNFIAFDSEYYAKKFIKEIRERIKVLKAYPESGRIIYPERYNGLRQILFKSYRIIYIYEANVVSITSIHHQHRDLGNIDTLNQFQI